MADQDELAKANKELALLRRWCVISSTAALILLAFVIVGIYTERDTRQRQHTIRDVVEESALPSEHARRLDEATDELESALGEFDTEDWREVVPKVKSAADELTEAIYGEGPTGEDWKHERDAREKEEEEIERKADADEYP
jgi:molecular chaperone DnaK (HSP70)